METEAQQLEFDTTYESRSASSPDAGLHRGIQTVKKRERRRAEARPCGYCQQPFSPRLSDLHLGRGLYCCPACFYAARRGVTPSTFHVADSTKAERIRANGLVNMRIRRGAAKRPKACQMCDKPGRVDAHHPDYTRPDLVAFLCRSCHMRCHHHAGFEKLVLAKIELIAVPSSPLPPSRGGAK